MASSFLSRGLLFTSHHFPLSRAVSSPSLTPILTFCIRSSPSSSSPLPRTFATISANKDVDISKLRNIGISAHIDSGKTTLTERILFYTGRISEIHEVKGKDGVGAKMDSMELEREKGITIQSAATHAFWGDHRINIIDTPGHVDFTIEVERALRVLDGAVLVLCGVSGVQSQTMTVDRQMRRYDIPRLAFINKLDRMGADPFKVITQLREKLSLNAAAMEIPVGLDSTHQGVVHLVTEKALLFGGYKGSAVESKPVPDELLELMKSKRHELIEKVANVDDELGEWLVLNDFPAKEPPNELLKNAIRRATLARKFIPVFMGAAYKNIGVQPLLDGVVEYLPNPMEVINRALDVSKDEQEVHLVSDIKKPFVGLAFKLEENRFGQLTYIRIYQGHIKRGDVIKNVNLERTVKVPRLVKMHANEMEDIQEAGAGEICAMFGLECYSGNTFVNGGLRYVMSSMHIPDPVLSLACIPKSKEVSGNFGKALNRFQKEDPTFRVHQDKESQETIISGMGELHLYIYVERMKREYGVDCTTGQPLVAYRETIAAPCRFDYTHKKQTGGAGQFARVAGVIEPIPFDVTPNLEFVDETIGGTIPPQFLEACRKGFFDGCEKGPTIGHPVVGVRMCVRDGAAHSVDSSDLAFRVCTSTALKQSFAKAQPQVLEPIMKVEIQVPNEHQGAVVGQINKRRGVIVNTESSSSFVTIHADVPLNQMFGYSTDLRSATQGKGEFTMVYKTHAPVTFTDMQQLIKQYELKRAEQQK